MSRIPYTNKVGETLSSIADSAAAYSLRALGGGDPMVVRVRRSSDDAEKDFTVSDLNGGTLVDWVGSGNDGFVSISYDQSENNNNAVQSIAANQPKIVENGVYLDYIKTDGVDDFFNLTNTIQFNSNCSIMAVYADAGGNRFNLIGSARETNGIGYGNPLATDNRFGMIGANGVQIHSAQATPSLEVNDKTEQNLVGVFWQPDSSSAIFSVNGNSAECEFPSGSSFENDTPITLSVIGKDNDAVGQLSIKEIIVFTTDQTSNRSAIETNINDYYDIY